MSSVWARSGWLHLTKTRNSQPEKGTTHRKAKSRDGREWFLTNVSEVLKSSTPELPVKLFFSLVCFVFVTKQIKFTLSYQFVSGYCYSWLKVTQSIKGRWGRESGNVLAKQDGQLDKRIPIFREKNETESLRTCFLAFLWHLNQKPSASLPNR